MIPIELGQLGAANSASHLRIISFEAEEINTMLCGSYRWDVIHIRLLHHRVHRMLNRSIVKFKVGMFFPDGLQVEERTIHMFLEEGQTSCVSDSFSGIIERN